MIFSVNRLILKVGINTFIQLVGKVFSVILSIFTVSLLTRYLGVDGYGEYLLIFTFLSFFGIFADFGLHLTLVKEISKNKNSTSLLYGTYFWLKVIFSLLSIIIPIIILFFISYNMEVKIGIIIGAIGISIGSFSSYNNALFQSKLRLDLVTFVELISRIVTTGFLIIFVYLKFQIIFLISSVLIGNVCSLIFSMLIVKRSNQIYLKFDKEVAKRIISLSFPIGIMSLLSLLYFKIDTIMISFLRNQSELGFYGFSYKIFENVLMLWGFYMASVFPLLAKNFHGNISEFNKIIRKSVLVAILSSIIIFLIYILYAKFIINLLGGEAFQQSYLSILLLLSSCPLFFINNIFFHVFLINNKSRKLILLIILSLLFNIIINFVSIPQFGYIGASFTTGLTELFMFIGYLIFLRSFYILKK
jgi:O-antigen/teichoic acid export membrane protein